MNALRDAINTKRGCKLIAFISLFIFLLTPNYSRADQITDIIDALTSMTCETQGMGQMLTTANAHTCVIDPSSNPSIASIISPQIYLPIMLRLKIGFDGLDALKGNCDRTNRADPHPGQTGITFGMCSNIQLIIYRAELIASAAAGIAQAAMTGDTGDDLWNDIKSFVMVDYNKFHDIFYDKKIGDNGIFFDLPLDGINPVLPWRVVQENDRICVATYTIFGTLIPVGCKYIREPYPTGLYQQFFASGVNATDPSLSGNATQTTIPADMAQFFNCSIGVQGCAQNATIHSQTMLPVSSIIIECIRSTLMNTLISNTTCVLNGAAPQVGAAPIQFGSSMFHTFQTNMQRAVMAFLTIYIMIIGFKLILGQGEVPPMGEIVMYFVKLILVIYFSVGININGQGRFDGMVQWVFPLLLDAANEMANWVAQSTPSGLCKFPINGTIYSDGMGRLALWDTLDCKVMHYLGFDTLTSMFMGGSTGDNFGNSVPPYVFLLIPALISGYINLIMLALSYPLVVMSVAAYLVSIFSVCLIAITVLAVLAPIYVPMVLFTQTKGYFESWYKLMISFTLQPVVVVGFMTVMFSVYDQGFYTGCEFEPLILNRPASAGNPAMLKQMYILKTDKNDFTYPDNFSTCQNSLGWILNQPLAALAGKAAPADPHSPVRTITLPPVNSMSYEDYQASSPIVGGIQQVAGVFFGYVALIGNINKQMIVSLFACILLLYLMRELSGQLSEFAADIADSVSLKSVSISPRSMTGENIKKGLEDKQDSKKSDSLDKRKEGIADAKDAASPKGGGSDSAAPKIPGRGGGDSAPKMPGGGIK